ncbi:MAG: rod shape-determining protein MreD [Limnochordia bacterium]|jgi:rod shape-determining protein MreD
MAKRSPKNYGQWLILGGLILLLGLLQASLFQFWTFFRIKPDLVLIFVVAMALLRPFRQGLWLGMMGGLLLDLFSGRYLGLHIFSKMIVAFGIGAVREYVYKENYFVPFVATFIGTVIDQGVYLTLASFFGLVVFRPEALTEVILPAAFYNSILTLFIYFRLVHLDHYLRELESRYPLAS